MVVFRFNHEKNTDVAPYILFLKKFVLKFGVPAHCATAAATATATAIAIAPATMSNGK